MKLWKLATFCAASLVLISGCAQPKPGQEATIDPTLPVVEFTKNATVVDMNAIAFEWKNITDPRVEGLYVYKLMPDSKDGEFSYYDTIANRFTTHYVDSRITPDTKYSYYFKTYSDDAESKKSNIIEVNSKPVLQSVSWIYSVQNMPRSAKIIWRPHSNQKVKSYYIERRTLEDNEWERIAEVPGRLNAEYIDEGLKDNYVYKYRVLVHTYDDITSTPSQIVKVVTKPLPKTIENIVASRDLPKKIVLQWSRSEADDFSHYNVYRSSKSDGSYDLIAKIKENKYTDNMEEDGKEYFYRISAVDTDGLESEHFQNTISGMTLAKPKEPALLEAKLIDGKVHLVWNKTDQRTQSYIVSKRYKTGWFDAKVIDYKDIVNTKFIDSNIEPNLTYYYTLYSVDKFGIKSLPSISVEIETKDLAPLAQDSKTKANEEVRVLEQPINNVAKKQEEIITPIQQF